MNSSIGERRQAVRVLPDAVPPRELDVGERSRRPPVANLGEPAHRHALDPQAVPTRAPAESGCGAPTIWKRSHDVLIVARFRGSAKNANAPCPRPPSARAHAEPLEQQLELVGREAAPGRPVMAVRELAVRLR